MKKGKADQLYLLLTMLDYVIACSYLVILVIFKLFALPFGLLKSLMSVGINTDNNKTEINMINAIREWVTNHHHDIVDAAETFGDEESYFIKITPKLSNAATLQIEVGYPKYLRISIDNLGIEFDEKDIDDGTKLLQKILQSYENGKYCIKKWVYQDMSVDQCLIINFNKNQQYQSKTDEFKILRKLFAKTKFKKFAAIASDTEVTPSPT